MSANPLVALLAGAIANQAVRQREAHNTNRPSVATTEAAYAPERPPVKETQPVRIDFIPSAFSILQSSPFKTTLDVLADRGIFQAKENLYSVKSRYHFLCPLPGHAHDVHPSFTVHADGNQWYCFPCGMGVAPPSS